MSLKMYNTSTERVCYVGWLLACDARLNIEKGERLLLELTEVERQQAEHHGAQLRQHYSEASAAALAEEDDDYAASVSRSKRR